MNQTDSIWTDAARFMLDQLLEDSRLYKTGSNYKALLDFIVRLRNFVSFNAFFANSETRFTPRGIGT